MTYDCEQPRNKTSAAYILLSKVLVSWDRTNAIISNTYSKINQYLVLTTPNKCCRFNNSSPFIKNRWGLLSSPIDSVVCYSVVRKFFVASQYSSTSSQIFLQVILKIFLNEHCTVCLVWHEENRNVVAQPKAMQRCQK